MESGRFRSLLDTPGPFVSVYFEDSHGTHDADAQLELKWRALREQLEQQGVDESVTTEIGQAIMELRPPVGRSGRAVVASAAGVLVNEHLLRPTAETVVRVSELPYIVPILELGFDSSDYLLVEVDHDGADITVHTEADPHAETVNGDRQADHQNLPAVADRVSELVDATDVAVVFVVGDVSSRSDLLAELPERVLERAVPLQIGARHSGHGGAEVQHAVEAWFLKRRLNVMDDAAQRFGAEIGRESGRAAEGLGGVCSALRQGAVDTLIMGDLGDATVVVDEDLTTLAPNADVLSKQGAAAAKTLRADEALPLFAISVGASLVRTDERIEPADGVAAVLRYTPSVH